MKGRKTVRVSLGLTQTPFRWRHKGHPQRHFKSRLGVHYDETALKSSQEGEQRVINDRAHDHKDVGGI